MLLGRLWASDGGRGKVRRGEVLDLPVLECWVDLNGRWGKHRAEKALRRLARRGADRVLLPQGFPWPELAEQLGLSAVEETPLIQAMAADLALAALDRGGVERNRACVALSGRPGAGEMARAACRLCGQVRQLVLPPGELADRLRWEYGIPVLPPGSPAHAALLFQRESGANSRCLLRLWAGEAGLNGLTIRCPALPEGEREDIFLISALYQAGKLGCRDLKVLDKGRQEHL